MYKLLLPSFIKIFKNCNEFFKKYLGMEIGYDYVPFAPKKKYTNLHNAVENHNDHEIIKLRGIDMSANPYFF